MKATLLLSVLLLTVSSAYADSSIAFETVVSLDRFRVINRSPTARISRVTLYPGHETGITTTASSWSRFIVPNTADALFTQLDPNGWVEMLATWEPTSTLYVGFREQLTAEEAFLMLTPLQDGITEGRMVPEPSARGIAAIVLVSVCFCLIYRGRAKARLQRAQ